MHQLRLRDFGVGPYVHLAVSAFTGRVGYIHRKFLPPFLRVDELRQPPHEPVAQAADVRGIRHGLAHPPLLLGHSVTGAVRREAPAHHSRLREPPAPRSRGGAAWSPLTPHRRRPPAIPRAPLPTGRYRRADSAFPVQLPL